MILDLLRLYVDQDGVLSLVSSESRSQWQNKQRAVNKFAALLQKALRPKKKRVKSAPPASAREQRLHQKKRISEKKRRRRIQE
jgi:ribosome-associated protein